MTTPPSRPVVLAIDDSPETLRILEANLGSWTDLYLAQSPQEALCLIEQKAFDLILMDLEFQNDERSGLALLTQLQSMDKACRVPVIIITSHDSLFMELGCRQAGASDYLTKPIQPSQLHERVRLLSGLKRKIPKPVPSPEPEVILRISTEQKKSTMLNWILSQHEDVRIIATPCIGESADSINLSQFHPELILMDGACQLTDECLVTIKSMTEHLKIPAVILSEGENPDLEGKARAKGVPFMNIGSELSLQRARLQSLLALRPDLHDPS